VYRQAWQREDALALLSDGVGTLFDERCVAELEALTAATEPASDEATHPQSATSAVPTAELAAPPAKRLVM
jgi:HD-GYP domain-containing protein (c-di-GMP phosphodiesterase class II)